MDIGELYKQWVKPVRSWLRNAQSVPSIWIDDLAQEVFARLLKYNPENMENPAGYIFRTAANVAHEWRERSRVRRPHEPEWLDDLLIDPEEQPENVLEANNSLIALEVAMSRLPSRQLLVLMMHVYEGQTYNAIARELGLTYRTVLRDLTRAYTGLRVMLRNTDLTDIVLLSPEDLSREVNRMLKPKEKDDGNESAD